MYIGLILGLETSLRSDNCYPPAYVSGVRLTQRASMDRCGASEPVLPRGGGSGGLVDGFAAVNGAEIKAGVRKLARVFDRQP